LSDIMEVNYHCLSSYQTCQRAVGKRNVCQHLFHHPQLHQYRHTMLDGTNLHLAATFPRSEVSRYNIQLLVLLSSSSNILISMASKLNPRAAPFHPCRLHPAVIAETRILRGSVTFPHEMSNLQRQVQPNLPPVRYHSTIQISSVPNTHSGLQRSYLKHVREVERLKDTVRKCDGACFLALKELGIHNSVTTVQTEIEKVLRAYEEFKAHAITDFSDDDIISILRAYEEPEKPPQSLRPVSSNDSDSKLLDFARCISVVMEDGGGESDSSETKRSVGLKALLKLLQLLMKEQAERRAAHLKVMSELEKARRQLREMLILAGVEIWLP